MISFRPAVRENVGLLIGLAGASGSGKTYTAMRLATGMSGGKRFAVIDTENGRASHYADQFAFDVAELHAPFSPASYADTIKAAEDTGYGVIVVDSMSHEHAGDGGILDIQEAEFTRLGSRDSAKMLSWAKPKSEHKRMMQRLLQTKAHLILCFRAEAKIEVVKEDGKTKVIPKQSLIGIDGWIPITEKTVPFELTVSLLLTPDKPGVPHPIKLQEQHRKLFPLDVPITEKSGEQILAWASGGTAQASRGQPAAKRERDPTDSEPIGEFISVDQAVYLETLCQDNGVSLDKLKAAAKVDRLALIHSADYDRAKDWLEKVIASRKQREAA